MLRLLPNDIRYALCYRQGLGSADVAELTKNGFYREALYIMLKVESEEPHSQLRLLRELAAIFSGEDGDPEWSLLHSFIESHLATMRHGVVKGAKLVQLSRQGFDFWYEMYRSAAERYAADERQLFLVGNATFLGLPDFIRSFARSGKPLYIIMPSFIEAPHVPACGYRIYNGDAHFLEERFHRPSRAVLLDDVLKTGATTATILGLWNRAALAPEPDREYLDVPSDATPTP